jgi:hypothetical protein
MRRELVTGVLVGGNGVQGSWFEPAQLGFVDLLGELGLALEAGTSPASGPV